ncbi:hypothetical protein ACFQ9J_28520 [Streptomyces sp. NPDC056529]|uniref:hypothetical protein n=1 Tax=Streptomyces sp. NPDC056529 TaxID=3345855 RepID=UPI00369815F2
MTQPEPAQPRHTADSITDDALTALYDERDELQLLLHDAEGDRDSWARDARRAEREAEADARKAYTDLIDEQKRAGRAEAERDAARNTLDRVRAVADEWAKTAQRYPDSRLSTETVAYVIRTALDPHHAQEKP